MFHGTRCKIQDTVTISIGYAETVHGCLEIQILYFVSLTSDIRRNTWKEMVKHV